MKQIENYFFELLQVAIGNRDSLSGVPTPEEWEEIYEIAKKQTLVGIAFKGVEKLPQEQLPPSRRLRQWYVKADKLLKKNERMNLECAKTCFFLAKSGFHSCILKGQANMRGLPPSPSNRGGDSSTKNTVKNDFCWYRTPGDIDVWAWSDSGKVSDIIREVKKINPKVDIYYHHADCNIAGDIETEVHYRASWMCAPWRNSVLQKFCNEQKKKIERYPVILPDGRKTFFFVPSIEFDAVYQLVHIYRHLFYEGIGLRQMMDYYMVLTNLPPVLQPSSQSPHCRGAETNREGDQSAQEQTMEVISKLGMKRFAGAVMFVMQEVFGMKDEYLLCEPNEKDGRFLLNEIMLAGNFGHADKRINTTKDHWIRWGIMKLRRNMKFLTSYPEEVLCEPFFRIFHWTWRTFKLWRY